MLKRGYDGTCHKMSPKHRRRYFNKFPHPHNVLDTDTITQEIEVSLVSH